MATLAMVVVQVLKEVRMMVVVVVRGRGREGDGDDEGGANGGDDGDLQG